MNKLIKGENITYFASDNKDSAGFNMYLLDEEGKSTKGLCFVRHNDFKIVGYDFDKSNSAEFTIEESNMFFNPLYRFLSDTNQYPVEDSNKKGEVLLKKEDNKVKLTFNFPNSNGVFEVHINNDSSTGKRLNILFQDLYEVFMQFKNVDFINKEDCKKL